MATDNTQNRIDAMDAADRPRHGLDDNANNDPEKGAALGGLGGAAVGAAAGSIAGPIGTIVGAIAGGLVGAGASGAAVAAIDSVDNDDTVTGVGGGVTRDSDGRRVNAGEVRMSSDAPVSDLHGHNIVTGDPAETEAGDSGLAGGAIVGGVIGAAVGGPVGAIVGGTIGSLAGGVAGDATEAADEATPERGDIYANRPVGTTDMNMTDVRAPGTLSGAPRMMGDARGVGGDGHNIVTGGPATTEAGDTGLAGGAVVGGVIGAAVGGPLGAVVGGTVGSLAGGVAGDAAEATDETGLTRGTNTSNETVYGTNMNRDEISNPGVANPGLPGSARSYDPVMPGNAGVAGDGHNIVTGEPAETEAGDTGLAGGAVVGGVIGAAVGGPVGAVIGGTVGSLAGGVAGDAAEASEEEEHLGNR